LQDAAIKVMPKNKNDTNFMLLNNLIGEFDDTIFGCTNALNMQELVFRYRFGVTVGNGLVFVLSSTVT
jgi:hypothetical protein